MFIHRPKKLVELISALQTSQETLDRARSFAEACGKGTNYLISFFLGLTSCRGDDIKGCPPIRFKRSADAVHKRGVKHGQLTPSLC